MGGGGEGEGREGGEEGQGCVRGTGFFWGV